MGCGSFNGTEDAAIPVDTSDGYDEYEGFGQCL